MSLAHTIYKVASGSKSKPPLVILHGLLGSKQNWASISKALTRVLQRQVIAVDARNHGESPHRKGMQYSAMAADVEELMETLRLPEVVLMGHSMGGKTAMTIALEKPYLVSKLIVVDIVPTRTRTVFNFNSFLDAMINAKIDLKSSSLAETRANVEAQLSSVVQDEKIRNFLLTNLVSSQMGITWRADLRELLHNIREILDFPEYSQSYLLDTLFVAGEHSTYIHKSDEPEICRLFPRARVVTVPNAGHWVHSDNPLEFIKIVSTFIDS